MDPDARGRRRRLCLAIAYATTVQSATMARRFGVIAALIAALMVPTFAQASDVIVQGTTDVRDAGLLDDAIIPGFQKAYPQYNLKYIAVGTGQALTNAE